VAVGNAGTLIVQFTDNTCLDDAGNDFTVTEIPIDEQYDVSVGLIGPGQGLTFVGTGDGTTTFDLAGAVASFNRMSLTDKNQIIGNPLNPGAEIDAVECLNSFELGTAHIQKTLTGLTTIQVGVNFKQRFFFDIIISNPSGEDLTDIEFEDVVPAEFDVFDSSSSNDADCTVSHAEGGAKGKGKGNQKLAPDVITIVPVGLTIGETCTISVTIDTDDDHPGKGNSPDFTPTSCPGGEIVANEGVKVFDTMGTETTDDDVVLFIDDDSLTLTCIAPAPLIDSVIDCDGLTGVGRDCPASQEVIRGDPLTNWPTGPSDEGIDGFDNDSSNSWTLGDDLHIERTADGNCPTAVSNGLHMLGLDCVVLDLDTSFFNLQPVDCDFETGTFCGAPPNMLTSGTGDLTFFDGIGADTGFYDTGEDIVLDVNKNGFFDCAGGARAGEDPSSPAPASKPPELTG
jgi:hypothetical protein